MEILTKSKFTPGKKIAYLRTTCCYSSANALQKILRAPYRAPSNKHNMHTCLGQNVPDILAQKHIHKSNAHVQTA